MIAAVLAVPSLDAIAKFLGASMSPLQIAFIRYCVQTVILFTVLTALRRQIATPAVVAALPRLTFMGALMAGSVATLFISLLYLPLANAIAIFFVAPLILTGFGVVFLGERVGWHRRAALAVGLFGTLVVLRPNVTEFGWAAVLPLFSAAGFAGVLTVLRSMRGSLDPLRTQAVSGAFATAFLGVGCALGIASGVPVLALTMPTGQEWILLLLLGSLATFFQFLFTLAVRLAEASLLAPFQYLEIFAATVLGYVIFDEWPDALTFCGTAIILAAGLYVFHRERRLGLMAEKAKPRVP